MRLPLLGAMNRIATQIVMLLALSSFAALAGVISIYLVMTPESELSPNAARHAASFVTVLRGLEALPPADRARLLAAYKDGEFTATILDRLPSPMPEPLPVSRRLSSWISQQMPAGTRIVMVEAEGEGRFRAITSLSDGQLIAFRVAFSDRGLVPLPFALMIGFMVASTVVLSGWAAWRLVSPLSRFATAVDRFGTQGHDAPIKEEGPLEIRQAAAAFNRMQERILRLIEDRTRMLMAISHDLRTPLTRLRLRAEELTEESPKRRMFEDIALMDASIASAVAYVREGGATETPEMAELPSLVEAICEPYEDDGHPIVYDGPRHLAVRCLPLALERALANLVDNAVKFGSSVTVRLDATAADEVAIEVDDDGPGIPDAEKPRVLEPFYRTDKARGSVGGFGLGLAIAHTVARRHGGSLTLHDRLPHGLRARLTIPRAGL
jgi:signal transduction histidine kinase